MRQGGAFANDEFGGKDDLADLQRFFIEDADEHSGRLVAYIKRGEINVGEVGRMSSAVCLGVMVINEKSSGMRRPDSWTA